MEELKLDNNGLLELAAKLGISLSVGTVIDSLIVASPTTTWGKVGFAIGRMAIKSYAGKKISDYTVAEVKKTVANMKEFGLIGALYE